MTTPGEGTREIVPMAVLNVEIQAALKDRLLRYARASALSQAAATRVALDDFLSRNGYPREQDR
jgi:hypothetical protein